jgi:ankyrin repeat protein
MCVRLVCIIPGRLRRGFEPNGSSLFLAHASSRLRLQAGLAPLHMAATAGSAKTAQALIAAGADVHAQASVRAHTQNPACLPRWTCKSSLARAPAHTLTPVRPSTFASLQKGTTALLMAVHWNDKPDVVRTLLSAGADANTANEARGQGAQHAKGCH